MAIDVFKIHPDYKKMAGILDSELKDFETGYYVGYGSSIAEIMWDTETVMGRNEGDSSSLENVLPNMRKSFQYLDDVYNELRILLTTREGEGGILMNKNTNYVFKCHLIYSVLKDRFDELETLHEQGSEKEIIYDHLEKMEFLASTILKLGRWAKSKALDTIDALHRMGCEDRTLEGKVPKEYEDGEHSGRIDIIAATSS